MSHPGCAANSAFFAFARRAGHHIVQTGLSFDLITARGKLMGTIMAGLPEFERDLVRERVKSGLAAARVLGVVLGRQIGQRPSDKTASTSSPCTVKDCPTA